MRIYSGNHSSGMRDEDVNWTPPDNYHLTLHATKGEQFMNIG
jgi:2'-5' RNA ligase